MDTAAQLETLLRQLDTARVSVTGKCAIINHLGVAEAKDHIIRLILLWSAISIPDQRQKAPNQQVRAPESASTKQE